MNKEMIFGLIRHAITVIAGGILVGNADTLDGLFTNLLANITSGNWTSITATAFTIIALLWSMWVKASETTKTAVVKTLTFKKG